MPHTNCYCKKHKHFGLSHVRLGVRPLVKSVKVVMVVPLRLRHQQCYNFRKKTTGKLLSELELASIPGASLFLIPLGPPVKV